MSVRRGKWLTEDTGAGGWCNDGLAKLEIYIVDVIEKCRLSFNFKKNDKVEKRKRKSTDEKVIKKCHAKWFY